MPIAAAAVSSSRIAIHARPMREYWSRSDVNTVISSSTIAVQKKTSKEEIWWWMCRNPMFTVRLQHCR